MSIIRSICSITIFSLLSFSWIAPPRSFQSSGKRLSDHDLTVSYSIGLRSKKNDTGLGETYNGGVKTIFISNGQARLRLVSLMRMQSIFILPGTDPQQNVAILKESGSKKYKTYLTAEEWKQYNKKYEGINCRFSDDTATVLRYVCKKAVLTLKSGDVITAFYTPAIHRQILAQADPAFACIPGLVLKYEYQYRKGTITYTATTVNTGAIDPEVFNVPEKGFQLKKYTPGQ
jgi:GLPGLI family protein